jgi:hypothetical protein
MSFKEITGPITFVVYLHAGGGGTERTTLFVREAGHVAEDGGRDDCDVLVIGGGPAGAVASWEAVRGAERLSDHGR